MPCRFYLRIEKTILTEKGLQRYLAFLLLTWLTISGLIVSSANADDTIIVIPTVNGNVQNHAALT